METLMLPFSPRFIVLTICAVVTALLLGLGIFDHKLFDVVLIPIIIFGALTLLGIRDLMQKNHAVLRNYPIAAHMRFLLEEIRPEMRQYFFESEKDGMPFSRDTRALVYQRAKMVLDKRPFGTQEDVYREGYEWMHHSVSPKTNANEKFRITIGGPDCSQPYSASVFNISAMSFGALSPNAVRALNAGAKKGGFAHDTGEGGFSPYHAEMGGDIVWEIGSGYFGCRTKDGRFDPEHFRDRAQADQVKMTEIKLSQGAKPGHGGVLPGPKVTKEIAETRDIEEGKDCLSPAAHSAFSTPKELLEFAARMREMSGGKPVGIKLCVGFPHELMAVVKAMLATGIHLDFIVVDGAEGGTGAAPTELSDRVGMPLREGLIIARNALVGAGLKGQVKLAASGKVSSGAALAMNAALGADWCNSARAFMFSLGCVQSMNCHKDTCPTGVATQSPARQRGLVVPDKAERVARFQKATLDALHDIVVAAGLETPDQFEPDHFRQRLNSAEMRSIDEIYPFLSEGELIAGTERDTLRRWWDAADPDSFRRRVAG